MNIDDILRDVDPSASDVASETRDIQLLTRLWVAERSAPELLAWPGEFLDRINDRIKRQIEKVEEMTGDMDPRTNFALVVIQTELERYKFLVRSYLRARIAKIDKYTLHYLSSPNLSPTEASYATHHSSLLHTHYLSSFLSSLPPQLRNLNDSTGNVSMVDKPDEETAVFVRLLRDAEVRGRGTDEDSVVRGREGDIFVVRWEGVRALVEEGVAELV
ncbi:related to SLD5 - part of GINS, replication multiprotein complex [Cephalotrichum gorgonifer]|uniref:DNA replication complex GINS protein SLD5 n=1 Tax=Cephalotrichum gorgonifer TaxID=2041049 RepID=A0AAE8SUE7_9PEZI|nr:related to SLD5 - part of GINS, replication multiprotein complex [Cephalotrichum gorgonifer]